MTVGLFEFFVSVGIILKKNLRKHCTFIVLLKRTSIDAKTLREQYVCQKLNNNFFIFFNIIIFQRYYCVIVCACAITAGNIHNYTTYLKKYQTKVFLLFRFLSTVFSSVCHWNFIVIFDNIPSLIETLRRRRPAECSDQGIFRCRNVHILLLQHTYMTAKTYVTS